MSQKLRRLRQRSKEEEDQYSEYHKNACIIEERCRNMKEVIKVNKSKKKEQAGYLQLTIEELEDQYKTLVFTKEEMLIQ